MDNRTERHRTALRARCAAVVVALVASFLTTLASAGPAAAVTQDPGGFNPITPTRALDTRQGSGCVSGVRNLTLAGQFGVPADAAAVLLNVAVVTPGANGFLTVYPAGEVRPTAANVNYVAGAVVPNAATVRLGAGGAISIYTSGGCPHVVVDVAGSYNAGPAGTGGLDVLASPSRLLDTRQPGTYTGCLNGTRTIPVPSPTFANPSASSMVLNVAVVTPTAPGFLTVYPAGVSRPSASSLNYSAGQVVSNAVTVKLGTGVDAGKLTLYSSGGCPHVVVDVAGSFLTGPAATGGKFVPVTPARVIDTRQSGPCVNGLRRVRIAGLAGVPANADAVTLNVAAVTPSANGFLSVVPTGVVRTSASNVNYVAGAVVPNSVTVPLGDGRGDVYVYSSGGCPHVVVDVGGWYTAPTGAAADPTFNINVQFADGTSPSTAVQTAFLAAERRWESIITADVPDESRQLSTTCGSETGYVWSTTGAETIDDLVIGANVRPIDGTFGVLGVAGPCTPLGARPGYFPKFGIMEFDSADLERLATNGTLADTVVHEMAHVLGFGTLWGDPLDPYWDLPQFAGMGMPPSFRDVITGAGTLESAYTGVQAKAQYALLGGSGNIPLETGGGGGTADAHWSEAIFGNELMTGYLGSTNRLSAMSVAAMADLGYSVDLTKADSYSVPSLFAALRAAAALAAPAMQEPDTQPVELLRPSGRLRDGHVVPLGN